MAGNAGAAALERAGAEAGRGGAEAGRGGAEGARGGASAFDEPLFVSVVIAGGMGAGLLVPGLANLLAPLLLPSLFLIVLGSLMPFRGVLASAMFGFDRRALAVVVWLQCALPILVIAGGTVLDVPDYIMPFVLLSACSGAVFATPTLAGLFALDRAQAARVMVLSTLLMPVSICVFLGPLIGLDNQGAFEIFGARVFLFLVVPAALILLYRAIESRGPAAMATLADRQAPRLGMCALSVFAIAIMAGVAEGFASDPGAITSLFLGALCVNMGMLVITRFALSALGTEVAHTASIVAMTRNVGLGYAMVGAFFGPELATYVALCQVPLLVGPLIVRLRINS